MDLHGNVSPIRAQTWFVDAAATPLPLPPTDVPAPATPDTPADVGPPPPETPPTLDAPHTGPPPVNVAAAPCVLRLSAPKRVRLGRKLKLTVAAPAGACQARLVLRRGKRRVHSRALSLAGGASATIALKGQTARRGRLTVRLTGAATPVAKTVEVR